MRTTDVQGSWQPLTQVERALAAGCVRGFAAEKRTVELLPTGTSAATKDGAVSTGARTAAASKSFSALTYGTKKSTGNPVIQIGTFLRTNIMTMAFVFLVCASFVRRRRLCNVRIC